MKSLHAPSQIVAPSLILAAISWSSGCGPAGPEFIPVSGVVTFEGAPVEEGTIMFLHTETQDSQQTELQPGGKYELEVLAGAHKIAIEPIMVETQNNPNTPPSTDYKKVDNIPGRYRSSETSGLTATVTEPAEISFDMTKKGAGK